MNRVGVIVGLGVGLIGGAAVPAGAQISPGSLAAPHGALEGALRCGSCHGPRGKTEMTVLCRNCHKEIAWLQDQRRGLHGQHASETCASCHPDHAGRDFALISWPGGTPDRFDHGTTGWPLESSHATVRCNACHKPAFRTAAAAGRMPDAASAPGWVGLDGTCTSCHGDPHRGTLPRDCASCHDASHWSPAPRFDHARSDFPLTGKHVVVRCSACHAPGTRAAGDTTPPLPVFKPVAHGDCSSCHTDPHHGRFAGPCRECHVTTGFAVIDRGNFNHDRTRFPLSGRHAAVACSACHDVAGRRDPPFATCTACHTDPHAGTATLAGAVVDCSACHSESGFKTPTFTVARHQTTRFRLEGKHAQVACVSCHVKNPPGVPAAQLGSAGIVLRPAFARCRDCHADDHGAQLAARPDRGECLSCHTPAGWTPSSFTVAAHATLRLPLEGRHAEIACLACHGAAPPGLPAAQGSLGKAAVALHPGGLECAACHVDPHLGRFAATGARPVAGGCRGCHTMRSFRPSTIGVDEHARFAFTLEGAHRAVPCQACHAELRHADVRSTLVQVRWVGAPLAFAATVRSCETCHQNPHGSQFSAEPASRGAACERCHGMDAFRPASRFDHDRDTKFPLRGGHANIPCARCHPAVPGPGGTRIVRYRPVVARCENCHGESVRQ